MTHIIALVFLFLFYAGAYAESALSIAYPLTENAVLLRDSVIPVRGQASAGSAVTLRFAGQTVQGTADGDGHWELLLQPLTTSATPRELQVEAAGEQLALGNILVGEVWFCGGQSNMAMAGKSSGGLLSDTQPAEVRVIGFGENHKAPTIWVNGHTHPTDSDGKPLAASSHAWQFAQALYADLQVPVGVMVAAKGAQPVEIGRWSDRFGDYPIRGVLFDQGESGGGPITAEGIEYWPAGMREVVAFWRQQWQNPDLPVLLVQKPAGGGLAVGWNDRLLGETRVEERVLTPLPQAVPPYLNSKGHDGWNGNSEYYREYWTRDIWDDHQVFVVQAVDLQPGLHPLYKAGVGRRDARVAMSRVYGADLAWHGPRYVSHSITGDTVQVQFELVGDGLRAAYTDVVQGFVLSGADKVFHWAEATITGPATIELRSPAVAQPVAVRYGWALDRSWANVFSSAGLPMASFRTDDWTPWGILEAKDREDKHWDRTRLRHRMNRGNNLKSDLIRNKSVTAADEDFTVRWQTGGGTSVQVQPDLGMVADSGEHTFRFAENTTIALQVAGPGGPQVRAIHVHVPRFIPADDSLGDDGLALTWFAYDPERPLATDGQALGTAAVNNMNHDLITKRNSIVKQPATLLFEGVITIAEKGHYRYSVSREDKNRTDDDDPILATLQIGGVRILDQTMAYGGATLAAGKHHIRMVYCLGHERAAVKVSSKYIDAGIDPDPDPDRDPNANPEISELLAMPEQTEGSCELIASGSDTDDDNLSWSFSMSSGPDGRAPRFVQTPTGATVTFYRAGTYRLSAELSDGRGGQDSREVTVQVVQRGAGLRLTP